MSNRLLLHIAAMFLSIFLIGILVSGALVWSASMVLLDEQTTVKAAQNARLFESFEKLMSEQFNSNFSAYSQYLGGSFGSELASAMFDEKWFYRQVQSFAKGTFDVLKGTADKPRWVIDFREPKQKMKIFLDAKLGARTLPISSEALVATIGMYPDSIDIWESISTSSGYQSQQWLNQLYFFRDGLNVAVWVSIVLSLVFCGLIGVVFRSRTSLAYIGISGIVAGISLSLCAVVVSSVELPLPFGLEQSPLRAPLSLFVSSYLNFWAQSVWAFVFGFFLAGGLLLVVWFWLKKKSTQESFVQIQSSQSIK